MKAVGRPKKVSALKGRTWVPILDSELLGLLHEGLHAYHDRWQDSLNVKAFAKVERDVKDWFGGSLDSAIERNYLKKLNNSASAPGAAGFERTLQALSDFPKFKELSNIKSQATFEKLFSKLDGVERDINPEIATLDKGHRCDGCEIVMRQGDTALQEMKRMGTKQGLHYWHLQCWFADQVRETVGEFRRLKGGLDKQSKAARAILSMAPVKKVKDGEAPSGFMLKTEKEYETWLSKIWETWCNSTKVKSAFHGAYFREFHEYADLMLLFHFDGNLTNTSFYEKFMKHISPEEIQKKFAKGFLADADPEIKPIVTLMPLNYADCRKIGEAFRSLNPVFVDVTNASEEDRKRIIDFMAGMTFALHGTIQRVTAGTFLALPAGVEVSPEANTNSTDAELMNLFSSSKISGSKVVGI
jgi:SepF-like predicted cell division protein (DUF552 family)